MKKKKFERERERERTFFCVGKNMHRMEEIGKFIIRGWDKKRKNKGR